MSRQRKIPTPAWQRPRTLGTGALSGERGKLLGLIGVIVLIVAGLAVIGAGYLYDWYQDRQRPGSMAISVNGEEWTVREFAERAKLYSEQFGSTSASLVIPSVATAIIEDQVLFTYAGEEGIVASDDEIKAEIAERLGITADDPNFDARYQEKLASIELSEDKYRSIARGEVLRQKLRDKFQAELPATVESVHYRQIQVPDQAKADEILAEINAGADFAALAAEHSTDLATKDSGGDMGWVPRGILADALENLLFSLDVNEATTYPAASSVFIYQVVEKDANHELEEEDKPTLASADFDAWMEEKRDQMEVENDMDFVDGDGDKIRWVIDEADLVLQ